MLNIPSIPEPIIRSIIRILRRLFELHERYTYSDSEELRKILILNSFPKSIDDIERKPAIVVTRGQFNWQTSSINRLLKREFNRTTSIELISGGVRINTIGLTQAEAEDIASHIFTIFMVFRAAMRREKFVKIESINLSQVTPRMLASNVEVFECPVDIMLVTAISWTMEPKGPLLEVVTLDINADLTPAVKKETIEIRITP